MNLVLDLGNTFFKLAFFEGSKSIRVKTIEKGDLKSVEEFIRKAESIEAAIVSSVIKTPHTVNRLYSRIKKRIILTTQTPLPLTNKYKSPRTLGSDRIAAAVGGNVLFPKQNVLAIDAGTCIKYDFVNSKGEYLGGAISPGIEMRLKSLNRFTDRLPLVKTKYKPVDLIGSTSEKSILSGVLNGAVCEIDGIIDRYKKQYSDLKVVISGGNSSFFEKQLKNSIFADPLLVLKGLNEILNYNAKRKK